MVITVVLAKGFTHYVLQNIEILGLNWECTSYETFDNYNLCIISIVLKEF